MKKKQKGKKQKRGKKRPKIPSVPELLLTDEKLKEAKEFLVQNHRYVELVEKGAKVPMFSEGDSVAETYADALNFNLVQEMKRIANLKAHQRSGKPEVQALANFFHEYKDARVSSGWSLRGADRKKRSTMIATIRSAEKKTKEGYILNMYKTFFKYYLESQEDDSEKFTPMGLFKRFHSGSGPEQHRIQREFGVDDNEVLKLLTKTLKDNNRIDTSGPEEILTDDEEGGWDD